jgi:hypothetical protein
MSRAAKYAYIVTNTVAFVQHPALSLWVRTHPCVLLVACEFCGARVGRLCESLNEREPVAFTHCIRRRALNGYRGPLPAVIAIGRKK